MKNLFLLFLFSGLASGLLAQSGLIDTTFNHTGRVFLTSNENMVDAVILPNGKTLMLASHYTGISWGNELTLIRLNEDGSLDSNFGPQGIKNIQSTVELKAIAMKLGNDSSVFILGDDLDPTWGSFAAIIKIDYDGNKISSYGTNGQCKFNIPGNSLKVVDFDLDTNNTAYVLGETLFMKILPEGVADTTFGNSGVVFPAGSNHDLYDIAVIDDSHIIAVGRYILTQGYATMIRNNGVPDSSFSNNGNAYYQLNTGDLYLTHVKATPNNEIIIAGKVNGTAQSGVPYLSRIDMNGDLDSTFSGGNFFHRVRTHAMDERVTGLDINQSGDIIFVVRSQGPYSGPTAYTYGTMTTLRKLLPNGIIDTTFGINGQFQDSVIMKRVNSNTLHYGSNKRILIAGYDSYNGIDPFAIRVDNRLNQSITVANNFNKIYGDSSFTVNAISSIGQPCFYSVLDTHIAYALGNTITIKNAGQTFVKVYANGSLLYAPQTDYIPMDVSKKLLDVIPKDTARPINNSNPTFILNYQGFVLGDSKIDIDTLPMAVSSAASNAPIGYYPITPFGGGDNNYMMNYINGTLTVFDPLGVEDKENDDNSIICYPNPSTGVFYIKGLQGNARLKIYDLNGRMIHEESLVYLDKNIFEIRLDPIPAGIYQLIVQTTEGIHQTQLVVQ